MEGTWAVKEKDTWAKGGSGQRHAAKLAAAMGCWSFTLREHSGKWGLGRMNLGYSHLPTAKVIQVN